MSLDRLMEVISKHWGFRSLRPLQEPAMRAVLAGRDSLVVLPTGGGKSLCYQAPAVCRGDTTVVVSPLISLMKDQVDSLRACGVPAAQFDSSQSAEERFIHETDLRQGQLRLVFAAPERLVTSSFLSLLQQIDVRTFAIDEAHCISHWGHDFRPEYRQLSKLKEWFPQATVHGYTATATERVRRDILEQLRLKDPEVLVGSFDRPNLTYRILPKLDEVEQACQILDRHKGEAGIIYCIRRKDVDGLTEDLVARGYKAMPYHAGMDPEARKRTQNAFSEEKCDLVVATVAFGMGIDRSNIRFVLHTGMPKSIEHYQQETGRAGRDGLEAECVLLHTTADLMTWRYLIDKSAEEAKNPDPEHRESALRHLNDMNRYCTAGVCRHCALVQYFGQKYAAGNCQACDICLGDAEPVPDSTIVAMKILSCVARVKESFGVNHVAHVLHGRVTAAIQRHRHEELSTFGLLQDTDRFVIQDWVRQLVGQGLVDQTDGEYPVLKLNAASWEVLRKQRQVKLVQPKSRKETLEKSRADTVSWEGVDRELFDGLKELRKELAEQKSVPPYVVFSDATLRELARVRPSTVERMHLVYGVGEAKLRDYGQRFLDVIHSHHRSRQLTLDVMTGSPVPKPPRDKPRKPNEARDRLANLAFGRFAQGDAIEDVMHQTQRSRSWSCDKLCEYIREERPESVRAWVADDVYQRVAGAAKKVGIDRLKPIHLELGEKVSYDEIRIVVAHLAARDQ